MRTRARKTLGRRIRRIVARILIVAGVAIPCALFVLWLYVLHVPEWYQPPVIPAERYQDVRDDIEVVFNEMSSGVIGDEPFEVVIEEQQINNWMVVGGEFLPEAQSWVPEQFEQPMVRLTDGAIVTAGTIRQRGVQSVVSLEWRLEFTPEVVRVRLDRARTGSLTLPDSLIGILLDRVEKASREGLGGVNGVEIAGTVQRALEGLDVENRFRWANGDRIFRITGMELQDGTVRLGIEPLGSGRDARERDDWRGTGR